MTNLIGDFRFGIRMLKKNPGHTAAAVVALALGIGLTASMFSIINGVLLTGLPFAHSDRLVNLTAMNVEKSRQQAPLPLADFMEWQKRQTSFSGISAFDNTTINLSGTEKPERFDGGYMTANAFDLLGVQPILGRAFLPGEDQPEATRIAVLGYGLWKGRYGGDPKILGRVIRVNGEPTSVVGVMPEGFGFPINEVVWVPLRLDPKKLQRGSEAEGVNVFGRLKDGVTIARAQAEMATIAKSLAREFPATNQGVTAKVRPYVELAINDQISSLLYTMLGAVGFVLLLACANVASLMMARASLRTRELAIRSALGAGRKRVLTQILIESLLLSALGAALGLGLAYFGLQAFNASIVDSNPPFWFHIMLSGRPLLFVLGITLLSGLLSGLAPALQASKADVNEVLKDEGRGSTSLRMGRFSRFVVVFEVAFSFALLVAAGLMVRSVVKVQTMDFGFAKEDLLTVRIALYEAQYPEKANRVVFWNELLRRLDGRPGIAAVAAMDTVPTNGSDTDLYAVEGRAYPTDRDLPQAHKVSISPRLFSTLGVRPLSGRELGLEDREGSLPVVVVNRSFAEKAWPHQDPLGRRIRLGKNRAGAIWRTVVGVVPDLQMNSLNDTDSGPAGFYLPLAQECPQRVNVILRTRGGDPLAMTATVRAEVNAINPDLPLYFVRSMEQAIAKNAFFFNLFGSLFAIFGGAALILAAVGIYGVISFSVQQRTQEIGVRMALGAQKGTVLGMIVRQGSRQLALGLALGLGIAFLASRLLGSVLFQVKPNDPATFAGVCLTLTAIALTACLIPAQRAARVDPLVAIRYD
ncbi:MAG TPA: ABC transporter permease [Thermoanaerobaculia bacterium]|nr:ABC transporter permease [Thermoanaerobaculia bacterium]